MSRSIQRQIRKNVAQKATIFERHMRAFEEVLTAQLQRQVWEALVQLEKGCMGESWEDVKAARDAFRTIFSGQVLTGTPEPRNVDSKSTSDSPCVP